MASNSLILYNGKIISGEKIAIALDSKWARFAPGFFETMKLAYGTLYFWEDHYERMKSGAKYWDVKIPGNPKLLKSG